MMAVGRHQHRHGPDCDHGSVAGVVAETTRIGDLVRARFRLGETAVQVEELETEEPGFPVVETRIAFWSGNEARHQYRIFKPAARVTELDLPPWWYKDALILDDYPHCDCCG